MKTKTAIALLLVLLLAFSSALPATAAYKTMPTVDFSTVTAKEVKEPAREHLIRSHLEADLRRYAAVVKNEGVPNTMNKNVIHMLKSVDKSIGDSFIITTKDGKVIVIDGGKYQETGYFIEYLKAVTGQKKPHIDAWFLSHPHDDHCEVFLRTVEFADDMVTFDRVYANFPTDPTFFVKPDQTLDQDAFNVLTGYYRLLPRFADKATELHKDDDFKIGDARFRVFFTFNPAWNDCNEASTIMRMDLGGKSVVFTGDANNLAGNQVIKDYSMSGVLRCDYCKMAHHGENFMGILFYLAVSPRYCLWPATELVWNGGNSDMPLSTQKVRVMMDNIGVEKHYVTMNGTQVIYLNRWPLW